MRTYCKYVVLSQGRTGSTLLTRMLRGHSCVVDYQELFNVNFQAEFRYSANRDQSLRYWLDTFDHAKAPRRPDPASAGREPEATILDKYVWHDGYAERIGAVGFKVLDYQLRSDGPFPSLREEIVRRLPELRIVVVTRRNLLKQYLSHVIAERIRQWHIADASQRRPRPRVQVAAEPLLRVFEHSRRVEADQAAMAAKAECALHFVFEDLVGDFASHWRQLQEFVEVPGEPMPELRLAKLEHRTLREAIENYDELKERFRVSDWEGCFDE